METRNVFRKHLNLVVLFIASVGVCASVRAEERSLSPEKEETERRSGRIIELTPYVWAAGLSSNTRIGATESDSEMDIGDILDALDGAIMLHLEVRGPKFGSFYDVMYISLSDDGDKGPLNIEVEVKQAIVEAGGMYSVHRENRTVDFLLGARYVHLDLELDIIPGPKLSVTKDWVDPFLGVRLRRPIGKKWDMSLRGDFGGFGVGSDSTWNGIATFGYRVKEKISLVAGYRYLDIQYDASRVDYDVQMHGPVFGATFKF